MRLYTLILMLIHRRHLRADSAALGIHATDLQLAKIRERSNAMRRKIKSWWAIQQLYMPGAVVLRNRADRALPDGAAEIKVEDLTLWLPSTVGRKSVIDRNIQSYEFQLREAQAHEALDEIRDNLRLRAHLFGFKNKFDRGVRQNTRSLHLITRCNGRVEAAVKKYTAAYGALTILAPILKESLWHSSLKVLDPNKDVVGMTERLLGETEGRRTLSWIWKAHGVGDTADVGLHDSECDP
jgi:hypothetical protein